VTDTLPDKSHHGWKYLGFAPDGALFVPVGAPCNVCLSDDARFASILRMDPDTGNTTIHARGIRNTVGFAWHPETGQLWFTDNGRDMLGNDVPAEEINVVTGPDQHFGYPHVHAGDILDPKFGTDTDPENYVAPSVKIQAHSAALGVDFYTADQFPDTYKNALFVAEHGSWNRSSKVGYQVSVVTFDDSGPHYEAFVTGWLDGQKNWGRPNDVLMAPDGSLLISDDQAGAVYRVSYPR
jgi:glucose/arabinose dehydrogenase